MQTGFSFRYFVGRSNTEITSAVGTGNFTTPTLMPGQTFVIRARVAVDGSAAPGSPIARFLTWTGDDAVGGAGGSCNSQIACGLGINPTTGNIGDNSCNAVTACNASSANIGMMSCNGQLTCTESTTGSIGDNSCGGGTFSCYQSTAASIGNNSCNGGQQACYQLATSLGDCANNVAGSVPPACPAAQPDGRIKRSGGPLHGDNIYNDTGAGQHIGLKIYATDFRRIYITAQNDSLVSDTLTIGVDTGSEPGFNIRWFIDRTDVEVTAAVKSGSFFTALAPSDIFRLRGRIAVSSAVPRGAQIERSVTIESSNVPGNVDVVSFSVKRK